MSDWIAVEITVGDDATEVALDILSGALFEAGAGGIETRDASLPVVVVASFPASLGGDVIVASAKAALAEAGIEPVNVTSQSVAPVDWATHWRKNFVPIGVDDFWVVPSWLEPPEGAQHILRLDPGMAFGTGSHETTQLCLERVVRGPKVARVLDVGTGTGILAMAALMLGATRVVGTDNDPDALVVAAENAKDNGLDAQLELSGADPDALGETFELVVANILMGPLIGLAPAIVAACEPGGAVILSGLLVPQVDQVSAAYVQAGLTLEHVETRGEWARVDLRRPVA